MAILSFIKKSLPWLGTVASIVGVPGAAPLCKIASSLLSTHLNTPVTPESLQATLTDALGDPAQHQALLQSEQDFQKAMVAMGYQNAVDMETLAEKDRESARSMQVQTKSWVPGFLAIAITVGFFGLLAINMFHAAPTGSQKTLDIMTGSLGTAWVTVVMFYYGSSAGSERKTELLATTS